MAKYYIFISTDFTPAHFGVGVFDSNIYGGVGAVVTVQVVLALYVMRAWKEVFGPEGEVAAEQQAAVKAKSH